MKIEDMPMIIKRELAKLCMKEERGDRFSSLMASFQGENNINFEYHNFRIASLQNIDSKWKVAAIFQQSGTTKEWVVTMAIDDETGEVTEVNTHGYYG